MQVGFKKWVFFVTLGTLVLNGICLICITEAAIVPVDVDCNVPAPNVNVYPDVAVAAPGDIVRWTNSLSCQYVCGGEGAYWQIDIPNCALAPGGWTSPPQFGFSGQADPINYPIPGGTPAGVYKYAVNVFTPTGVKCRWADPYIQCGGGGGSPTLSEWVLIVLALSVGGFFIWQLKRRKRAVGSVQ